MVHRCSCSGFTLLVSNRVFVAAKYIILCSFLPNIVYNAYRRIPTIIVGIWFMINYTQLSCNPKSRVLRGIFPKLVVHIPNIENKTIIHNSAYFHYIHKRPYTGLSDQKLFRYYIYMLCPCYIIAMDGNREARGDYSHTKSCSSRPHQVNMILP